MRDSASKKPAINTLWTTIRGVIVIIEAIEGPAIIHRTASWVVRVDHLTLRLLPPEPSLPNTVILARDATGAIFGIHEDPAIYACPLRLDNLRGEAEHVSHAAQKVARLRERTSCCIAGRHVAFT